MSSLTDLPFYTRDKESLRIFTFNGSETDNALRENSEAPFPIAPPKISVWSPNGMALALLDPVQGAQVATIGAEGAESSIQTLPGAPKGIQGLTWSSQGGNLITSAPATKGSQEPNVHIWRIGADGGYACASSFHYPKLERDKKVLQWTMDESLCARLTAEGLVHILPGDDLGAAPLVEVKLDKPVQGFEFAPKPPRNNFKARLAVFVADSRDDLQRVVGPAEATIYELITTSVNGPIQAQERAKAPLTSGQMAELMWNCSGSALLAHSQTEVDESGQSYYGGSRLVLVSHDGEFQKDLTLQDDGVNHTSVQAVSWSPVRNEFILILGFQPSKADLWQYDEQGKSLTLAKVLLEKAHRNTIRFNPFGSLVCLAGFGNLAGQVDFFGKPDDEKCDFVRISSCQANCTVHSEWAPDGRHFLTSVLAPRMRVDNGFSVWNALSGTRVVGMEIEELYETQWQPEAAKGRFPEVTTEEVLAASLELAKRGDADAGATKKQAYRPPKARGEGTSGGASVAAMMRGEIAAPDGDDRRQRKPRPARQQVEEQPQGSPRTDGVPPWGEQDHSAAARAERGMDAPQRRSSGGNLDLEQEGPQRNHPPPPAQRPPPPVEAVPTPPMRDPASQQQQQRDASEIVRQQQQQTLAHAAAAAQREVQAARELQAQREREATASRGAQQTALEAAAAAAAAGYPGVRPTAQQLQAQAAQAALSGIGRKPAQPGAQQHAQAQQTALLAAQHAAMQQHAAAQQVAMQQQQQLAAREREQREREAQREQAQREQHARLLEQRQAQAAQMAPQARQAQMGHGSKLPCPTNGWQYVDPKQNIQGPFTLLEMQQWNQMGYFRADLPMRCDPGDQFVPFADLFPHPLIPFQSYPKRPQRVLGVRQ